MENARRPQEQPQRACPKVVCKEKCGGHNSRINLCPDPFKLHEEAQVEINDYGNDLSDIETFAKHLGIEINTIDAEQFNSIIYTANKGHEDKIYLLNGRNHFDVIKSLTAFYDSPYYCHECKKAYTKRDNTSVHQSVYLALPMQKNGNAMAKK